MRLCALKSTLVLPEGDSRHGQWKTSKFSSSTIVVTSAACDFKYKQIHKYVPDLFDVGRLRHPLLSATDDSLNRQKLPKTFTQNRHKIKWQADNVEEFNQTFV